MIIKKKGHGMQNVEVEELMFLVYAKPECGDSPCNGL